jgi:hypothetical protein
MAFSLQICVFQYKKCLEISGSSGFDLHIIKAGSPLRRDVGVFPQIVLLHFRETISSLYLLSFLPLNGTYGKC